MKLRYTFRGAAELNKILTALGKESPQGARNVGQRIQETIDLLLQYPQAGQLTSKRRLRRIVVHPYPYLIFYTASGDELVIHSVRHGARHPSSMPG